MKKESLILSKALHFLICKIKEIEKKVVNIFSSSYQGTFLLGVSSVLVSPPFYFLPSLSFVMPILWMAIKKEKLFKTAFCKIYLFYGGHMLGVFYWFLVPMVIDTRYWLIIPFAALVVALFIPLISMPFFMLCTFAIRKISNVFIEYLIISISWFAADWARAHLLCGGMPWYTSGVSFSSSAGMLRIAGYFHQWQLDLIMAFIISLPYLSNVINNKDKRSKSFVIISVLPFLLMYLLPSYRGYQDSNKKDSNSNYIESKYSKNNFNIYGLQGGIHQKLIYKATYSHHYRDVIFSNYVQNWQRMIEEQNIINIPNYNRESWKYNNIIAIPEGVVVFYDMRNSENIFHEISSSFSIDSGNNVILFPSIVARETEEDELVFENAITGINQDGKLLYLQAKKYLVPFGEYIPIRKVMPDWLESIVGIGDLSPAEDRNFANHLVYNGLRIATVICYEIAFDHKLKDKDGNSPDIIISLANDSWIGRSLGLYQHLAFAKLRAAILRVPVFHVVNNGPSALIDKNGRVIYRTNFNSLDLLSGKIIRKVDNGKNGKKYILKQ